MDIKNDIPQEENKDRDETEEVLISGEKEDNENFNDNIAFKYLKELSSHMELENEDGEVKSSFQFIEEVDHNSVLANYLNKKPAEKDEDHNFKIIPFGFNLSQKEAVQTAFDNKISIIEGSSVSSSTDAILNIVLNAVINDKTVAIISESDFFALKFVEILNKVDMDFIIDNIIDNESDYSKDKIEQWLSLKRSQFEKRNLHKERGELKDIQNTLREMLENEDKLSLIQMEKANLLNEISIPDNGKKMTLPASILVQSADKIMLLLEEYTMLIKKDKYIKFLNKIRFLFKYGISEFGFYNNKFENVKKLLINRYNQLKISELDVEIESLKNKLDRYIIEDEIIYHKENSLSILKGILYERYSKKTDAEILENEEGNNSEDTIKKNKAVITSINSFKKSMNGWKLFDYVIIDEAEKIDIFSGALILACARNIVLMSDPNQVFDGPYDKTNNVWNEIYKEYSPDEYYDYLNNSLLSSITKIFPDTPKTVLVKKYRGSRNPVNLYN
ncbi:hypothetical protein D2A34_03660 [Clostridium chromiireducens]|uniref:DNA2/NAM7 helicase helicase domain-containing protein n=1 Tax=Clostridium chromiireducens TaxID=225345 RepID=A0A399ITS7_9CLOT|nr:hypothetical protein [Clostridium chromiireducens]RII36495.1 hypothetical protein D2A34_03660 [Clostridium chromiireducens]